MGSALKIAIIGDSTSVQGFRPLGFSVFPTREPADARDLWREVSGGEYAVVLVTEPVWDAISDLAEEVIDVAVPAITVIPGAGSPGGVGQEKLDHAIVRALGTTSFIREEGK